MKCPKAAPVVSRTRRLREAGYWAELHRALADLDFLDALWREDQYEARRSWACVERETAYRVSKTYEAAVSETVGEAASPDAVARWSLDHLDRLRSLAALLACFGHRRAAHQLRVVLLSQRRRRPDEHERLVQAISDVASGSAYPHELELGVELERLCEAAGDQHGLQCALGHQEEAHWVAVLTGREEDETAAKDALRRRRRILARTGDRHGLQDWMFQLTCMICGNHPDAAVRLTEKREALCRDIGDLDGLHSSLRHRAAILADRPTTDDHTARAYQCLVEAERLCRDLGHAEGLVDALCDRGVILVRKDDARAAAPLFDEAHTAGMLLDPRLDLADHLGIAADWHRITGRRDEALLLYAALEEAGERHDDDFHRQYALSGRAAIELTQGRAVAALALYREQEWLCRKHTAVWTTDHLCEALQGQVKTLQKRAERRFDDDQTLRELARIEREQRLMHDAEGIEETLALMAVLLRRAPAAVKAARRRPAPALNPDQSTLPLDQDPVIGPL